MEFPKQDDQNGSIYTVIDNDQRSAAHISPELLNDENIGKGIATIKAGLDAAHSRFQQNSNTYKSETLPSENARTSETLKATFKSGIADLRKEAMSFAEADLRSMEPAALADGAWESRFVTNIRALPSPERIRAISDLSFVQSSALLRYGDLDRLGVPPDVIEQVRERHQITGHVARTGMKADYARRPTLADPLATGVDEDAAYANASAVVQRHRQRGEHVKLAADVVRRTAQYVALATGKSPETIFAEWTVF